MSRLIVKNIPNQISESKLKEIFEKKGEVTDVKVIFKENKNRKFCFVGYKKEADAIAAQKYFDNTFVLMSRVKVEMAKTVDDPNLPRAWSRHSKGSSAFAKLHQDEPAVRKQVRVESTKHQKGEQSEKSEKFKEFLTLMKQTNTSSMPWSDNVKGETVKNSKQEVEEIFDKLKEVPEEKPAVVQNAAGVDERRLYVTNIPYNSTEAEIREVFSKFGTVVSLKVPKMRGGSLSGFCFVQFALSEEAMRAYVELDNKIVLGRILHVRPAFEEDKKPEEQVQVEEKSSFKKYKKQEMLERLEDTSSWNTLFLNPNTIIEYISQKYNMNKRDILSEENEDIAIKMSQMETQIVKETKDWFRSLGLNIDFLKVEKGQCERSNVTIFVKNLQFRVDEKDLHELFARHGKVASLYLSPNRCVAIVQYGDEQSAANAFKSLSFYKHKGSLLYLEWAPKTLLSESASNQPAQQEGQDDELSRIIYIKNLNFKTTEDKLTKLFAAKFSDIKKVTIVRKDGLSKGYGFIEFATVEDAGKAIRSMNEVLLDDHALKLSQSTVQKKVVSQKKAREEVEASNKLVIRNVPFEATLPELKKLIKQYGEVKKMRLPKKLDGSHRGFAFAEFVNVEEAQNVYESLLSTHFYGRRLVVEYSYEETI